MTPRKRSRDPGAQQMRKCTGACKLVKGRNAFVGDGTVCRACANKRPPEKVQAGPTAAELENDAAFLAFSRKVREDAGVPVGGSR